MIPIEVLRGVREIITHDNCADGIASAMILRQVFPDAAISFMQHDTRAHENLPARPGMLFCDFSPPPLRAAEFLQAGAIVLDHHWYAREVVGPFVSAGLGAFGDEKADRGVCGAVLAFREVWQPWFDRDTAGVNPWQSIVERVATLAGVRDTWLRDDARWDRACEQAEALRFWPIGVVLSKNGQHRTPQEWEELLSIGPVVLEKNLASAKKRAEMAYRFATERGRTVAAFEGARASSDAADFLGTNVDIAVGFSLRLNDAMQPSVIFSCRSRGEVDVGALALAHGGGGHTKAAGFRFDLAETDPHPFALLKRLLNRYEGVELEWHELLKTIDPKKESPSVQYAALLGRRFPPCT